MKENIVRQLKRWILAKLRLIPDILRGTDYSKEVVWNNELLPENSRYSMSTGKLRWAVKKYLSGKNLENRSIVDIGCGKGKMLEFFSKQYFRGGGKGFKRVAGVEFSKELCDIATRNMKTVGVDCDIYCADAASFDKYNEFDYFYMFNPMKGELLRNTIKKIKTSIQVKPREIHLIYCNPWSQDILQEEGYEIEEKLAKYAVVYTLKEH